jgi:hypothetical protein
MAYIVFNDVAGLLASSAASRGEGQIWRAGSFLYEEAASGASDHDVTTSGGVKLYALATEEGKVTPAQFGATGSGNDRTALVAWLDHLAANTDRVGWVDRDYSFATTITHSGELTIQGPFSDSARLIYTGTGDGFEFTGAVNIDGVVVDGNLASDAIPTIAEAGCLLGIHGPLTGTPGYLSGVKIGRLRVQNTRRRSALALINLRDLVIDRLEAFATYGNAFKMCGLVDAKIGSYKFDRVGDLAALDGRIGAGIAFYAEGDAGKLPATWYAVAGIQPTDNVEIGPGQGTRVTDTSIYLHDGYGSGVKNVRLGNYQGSLIGKDAIKFRQGVTNCTISSAQVSKVGMRFAVIEEAGTDDCSMLNVQGDRAGYDAIGEWLDGSPGARNYTSEENGLDQTLNNTPGGFRLDNADRCVVSGVAKAVRDAPHNNTEGNALSVRNCIDSNVDVILEDADGLARIGDLTRCTLLINATNMGRNGGNTTAAVYCDDDDDSSVGNILRVVARETSGSAVLSYPCRINGSGTDWDVDVSYQGPFTLPSNVVTRSNSGVFLRYNPPPIKAVQESITFDGTGAATYAHGMASEPVVTAAHEGSFAYEVRVTSCDGTNIGLALYRSDTGAAVLSTSRTIHMQIIPQRHTDGFVW